MAVKPSLVSKEAKQRSGDLPTLPFRRSAWRRPSVPEHLAAQLVYRVWSASQRPKTLTARRVIAIVRSKRATASAAQQPDDRAAALCGPVGHASRRSMLPSSLTLSRWQRMGKQVEWRLGTALVTLQPRYRPAYQLVQGARAKAAVRGIFQSGLSLAISRQSQSIWTPFVDRAVFCQVLLLISSWRRRRDDPACFQH